MIDVRAFRKAYDRRVAVRDLSFAVQPGEIPSLVGPNGVVRTKVGIATLS